MRAFGYIRVSKLGEESISPEIQRDEITKYCEQKGWTVVQWFQDLDLSGRSWDRRKREGLDELMTRALSGECDVVVFYRIDRLSREEADFHPMLASLRRAGVHCDSPSNPNDGSAESDLIWSISAALAKYESVRLGARLRDAHKRLAKTGRWHGGPVPWGWKRVEDDQGVRLVADPSLVPWRMWMHEHYQAGWSMKRIARHLNEHGIMTRDGKTWSDPNVRCALTTPYQVGSRKDDGHLVNGGNVEALIPMEVYERTLAAMEARKGTPQGGRPPQVMLTGRHVRCGNCGGPMYSRNHAQRRRYFECRNRTFGMCTNGVTIKADELIPEVTRQLLDYAKDGRGKVRTLPVEKTDASEVKRLEQGLGKLASLYASGELREGEYREARKMQLEKLRIAEERAQSARSRAEAAVRSQAASEVLRGLGGVGEDGWAGLGVQAQRDIMDILVEAVTVYREHPNEPARIVVEWR